MRCPRFRSWRPARCPAKLQRSGVPVVKLRQDSMPQHVQKTVNRDEPNDLHSLKCLCRDRWIDVFSRYGVVEVGAVISMPECAALEWTWFAFRRTQKYWHSRHHPRVSKPERRQATIISDDGSFCARRLPACHTFPLAYRIKIVGFVCYSDDADLQISVIEFQHFGCGEGALCDWARLPRVRRKAAVSFEPRRFSRS